MSFERVLRRVHLEPWLILPQMHQRISAALESHIAGTQAFDLSEFIDEPPSAEVHNGVAVIPVRGVISKDISKMEQACGGCDVRQVEADVQAALDDPEVDAMVLDIDSPGGTVSGVPELAAFIQEARSIKPIISYTDGVMASAAYWIGASASAIYSTPSATVGSIGVYMPLMDVSRAYEAQGVSVDLVKTGEHKGAGFPGMPITEAQRDEFQASVDHIYGHFATHVENNRGASRDVMDGRTFYGDQAVANKLVDSNVSVIGVAVEDAGNMAMLQK